MYLGAMAEQHPDRLALVIEDGEETFTYAELDAASNRVAHALRGLGLVHGDGVVLMMENCASFAAVWWAAMRTGLYLTPVNWHLAEDEVRHIVSDSGARVVIASAPLGEVAERALQGIRGVRLVIAGGEAPPGALRLEALAADQPVSRVDGETGGAPMFYSSGTTGRPKGIRPPLSGAPPEAGSLMHSVVTTHGMRAGDVYLSPGPLYHSSPSLWSFGQHTIGATAVVMRRFDPEQSLRLIERRRVTHSQWVPTMFTRLLRLPDEVRGAHDLSSHRVAFHAAAPCPVPVKRAMIEWWGPILVEFYAGTEGGSTRITSEEWLRHPGSVGRHWTGDRIWILDPRTRAEMPVGEEGLVYFRALENHRFEYHNDPEKTRQAYHGDLVTCGDIGYLDAEGYLYLTDRQSDMIVSGGVNIYPREVENVLLLHPAVGDAAVFGVPDDEYGEAVHAVVEPAAGAVPSAALAGELLDFCRARLAHFKCPRAVDFEALPRDANGKLYKRVLRARHWEGRLSKLV
jgi:long-chain acyl-CoA synthetase